MNQIPSHYLPMFIGNGADLHSYFVEERLAAISSGSHHVTDGRAFESTDVLTIDRNCIMHTLHNARFPHFSCFQALVDAVATLELQGRRVMVFSEDPGRVDLRTFFGQFTRHDPNRWPQHQLLMPPLSEWPGDDPLVPPIHKPTYVCIQDLLHMPPQTHYVAGYDSHGEGIPPLRSTRIPGASMKLPRSGMPYLPLEGTPFDVPTKGYFLSVRVRLGMPAGSPAEWCWVERNLLMPDLDGNVQVLAGAANGVTDEAYPNRNGQPNIMYGRYM